MSAMGTTNKEVGLMKMAYASIRERINQKKVADYIKEKDKKFKKRVTKRRRGSRWSGVTHVKRTASMYDVYLDKDAIARAKSHTFEIDKTPRKDGKPGCEKCGHNSFKTVRKPTHNPLDCFSIRELREIECRNPNCKHRIMVPFY